MLIEQIDDIGLESLERGVGDRLNVLGPAVQASLFAVFVEVEPELRGDRDLPTQGREGFTYEFLIEERAVNFRSIEQRDAEFHGCPDDRDHFRLVFGRTVTEAHSHAAEADG